MLGRLVRDLIVGTHWTCSPEPDNSADVNYLFPYLEFNSNLNVKTDTAAWFTHFDAGRKAKEIAWENAARGVGLRLTSAPMYRDALLRIGATELVVPSLDLDKFSLRHKATRKHKKIVGVSGYTYPGGRKGESLVRRLALEAQRGAFEVVASGRGWPCNTVEYTWDAMQEYYHTLDVCVCTSTIEGIPMPPLEAMACGIPVVIPSGVGLLDTLPDLPNIFRYELGDFETMIQAVKEAIDTPVNAEELRSAVEGFTLSAWANSTINALEAHFGAMPSVPSGLPDWRGRAGVYVVAFGEPARQCAARLVKSVHKFMPDLPIAVAGDRAVGDADVVVDAPDLDIGGRSIKTQIYDLSPQDWDYVLYLDADTEVVADISFLLDLLADGWELVFCTNPPRYALAEDMKRPDNQEEIEATLEQLGSGKILQLNGGVFGFRRCEATQTFFDSWHAEWDRWGARDQAALDRALYANPVRLYVLGCEWNTSNRYFEASRTAGIMHWQMEARRWKGRIGGRLDSSEAWAALHPGRKQEAR